jgi:DNA-binding MarR family transcriptional regulator
LDYIDELGSLALASRLKRLLNRMHADGEKVYRDLNIDFKTKWFPVLHLLANRSPMTLMQIADTLKQAHPSVIEVVDELIKKGLVSQQRSAADRRRRELSITPRGKRMCEKLAPVWAAFREAGEEVNVANKNNVLAAITKIERAIDSESLYDRIMKKL